MTRISLQIISILILIQTGCQSKSEKTTEETSSQFLVTSPLPTDTTFNKEYVCQIRAIQHIELRALEKGYLQNIYVDEGQQVKKGQAMFQIMPSIYQAEKQKAMAENNFAEIEYLNTKTLSDSNIVSKNELALARAKFDKAKAELNLADAHLKFTEIRAPFDGIMDRFNVRMGSLVDEGELLTSLSDNSQIWVYFNVPESEYLNYMEKSKVNGPIKVRLQMANGKLFEQEGIIETIEADFNSETGNIAFRALFPNPNRILRHGETGNILVPTDIKNGLIIPQQATFDILDKKYVYVLAKDNTLQARQIKVSHEMPHLFVISEGLTGSDKILIEGLSKVKNNEKINPTFKPCLEVLSELNQLHAE